MPNLVAVVFVPSAGGVWDLAGNWEGEAEREACGNERKKRGDWYK